MNWYKLVKNTYDGNPNTVESSSGWFIPFDPSNTDYQHFKKDLEEGAELQDDDGKKMTKSKVTAFIKTLP